MLSDEITKIWLDENNRICIKPRTETFEQIYRSAMGVQWNTSECFLYPVKVVSWTSVEWYRQIISAVRNEYGYNLYITEETVWEKIDKTLQNEIIKENRKLELKK